MSVACGAIRAAPPAAAKTQVRQTFRSDARTDGLRLLQQTTHFSHFRRNETIFNKGDRTTCAYRVVSGLVRICAYTTDGRRQIFSFRKPGEFFGFLQGVEYTVTAEATCKTTLARYLQPQLDALIEASAGIRHYFTAVTLREQHALYEHMIMLGRQTAIQRLARFLQEFAGPAGHGASRLVRLPMSRQDIADYLGLTAETVCRSFHELNSQGAIVLLDAQRVQLRGPQTLERMAAGES
jgi:CRP-like cAMP-binding protein